MDTEVVVGNDSAPCLIPAQMMDEEGQRSLKLAAGQTLSMNFLVQRWIKQNKACSHRGSTD